MNSHDRRATPRPIAEGKFDAVDRHTPSSFTGYLEWDLLSAAQNHCVPPHQFVVPPLGGSVWRHGIGLRPTIPPKGGTTNCAFSLFLGVATRHEGSFENSLSVIEFQRELNQSRVVGRRNDAPE